MLKTYWNLYRLSVLKLYLAQILEHKWEVVKVHRVLTQLKGNRVSAKAASSMTRLVPDAVGGCFSHKR